MNYIESLTLENFQSHKNTTIKLAPSGQLTVIVGPSDSGKTAIIRGLKLLAYNSPSGTDFIRVGAQSATATAIMGDGTKVSRERSRGGINRYILESEKLGKQRFEGFGIGNPPLEIQQALEIAPIDIGDQSFNLNLSEQLDGPFLGNSVPVTAKAKVLGKLSGVEEVDHAGKMLGTDLYRMNRDKEGYENQAKHLTKEIEGYAYLDELGPMVEIVDNLLTEMRKKIEKKQLLLNLKVKLDGTRTAIHQEKEKIASLRNIDAAYATLNAIEGSWQKLQKLTLSNNNLKSIIPQIRQAEEIIETTKDVDSNTSAIFAAADKNDRLLSLQTLAINMDECKKELNAIQGILEATKDVQNALDIIEPLFSKSEQLYSLKLKKKSLEWVQQDIQNNNKVLEETNGIDDLLNKITDISIKTNTLSILKIKQSLYKQKQFEIQAAIKTIADQNKAVDLLSKNLIDLFQEAGTCPMCGHKIESEELKEAI